MKTNNLLLKNCKIITEGREFLKQVSIVDGKIEKITSNDSKIITDKKTRIIDVKNMLVMPGVIDPHVHFREPGNEHKENFFTGGKAAAKGGVTTILDMPNTNPPTITVKDLDDKRELATKCVVNFGFHFGASKDNNIEEIKNAKNIASVKIFLNQSTGKMLIEDDELLQEIFTCSKKITVHAEGNMVSKAIRYNRSFGKGLYLCHISQKSEIEDVTKSKSNNEFNNKKHPIWCEVTPHHLFLTEDHNIKPKSLGMMLPALATKEDQQALWGAIENGVVDTIGTDHAPHTLEEKNQEEPPYGIPGVETMLPLMLNAVNLGKINIEKLISLCCHNPATIFKIKNKGFLREGYDADIIIVDMTLEKEIRNEDMASKCQWTPYHGMKVQGWPIMTIVNGNVVYENGEISTHVMGKEVDFNG